jgi:hypothetical protein
VVHRAARLVLVGGAAIVLAMALAMVWLVTFDSPADDGFGGHVDALYEHVDTLQAALTGLVPAIAAVARP